MFTIISRIIHYGFVNFWRNAAPSAATVAIMVIALSVFSGLILFGVVTESAITSIQNKIDISVYFKTSVPEDEILNVKRSLESLAEVKEIEYVSASEALERFKERHADDETISRALNELTVNPLQPSLNIKARKPEQYASIAEYLSAPNLSRYFDKVTYFENQVVIDRLVTIINNVNRLGLALTVILAVVAGLVVFNTIRLAIYSNREEIGIMRAVGASNAFVRGPYMIEGVIAGVISAVSSLLVVAPIVYFVSPYFSVFIPGLNLFQYFYTNIFNLLFYQLLFGILIGALSSFIAVRRYLRN